MPLLVPTPNIQPNLDPLRNRHTSMQPLLPAPPIRIKILPEHRRTRLRQERNPLHPLPQIPTLDKVTPPLIRRPLQQREIRPSPLAIRREVNHEGTHSPRNCRRARIVVVVRVMARAVVALRPETLDESVAGPALEGQRSLLDALDRVVAGDAGFFAFADGGVEGLGGAIEDCAWCPVGGAGGVSEGSDGRRGRGLGVVGW